MVQFLCRNDSTLYQPIHTQAGFLILAHFSHLDGGVTDGKLEILPYVWVETHDIHILASLIFMHFIVEPHGLRPASVQSITGTQWSLSHNRMREQVGFLLKFTFPLHFDMIARSCYLLKTRHGAFISLGQSITAQDADLTYARAKHSQITLTCFGLGAVSVHA